MFIKVLLLITLSSNIVFGMIVQESGFDKERQEILRLKQELNDFYNAKEQEYQQRKNELDELLAKVEKTKKETQDLKNANEQILNDIRAEVTSKTSAVYNTMKPKNAAGIFDKMIAEGKIQDVFDIMIRLKTKNVTDILKFLNVENAAILTKMMQDNAKTNNQ